ncbi:hypothetical protein JCM9279_006832 [Rhodotorula babjevae]
MSTDTEWTQLLAWLATFPGHVDPEKHVKLVHNAAGRGLVARGDAKPSTLLISIPHAALLNLRTLRPLYPKPFHSLSATQLLSLHLARQFRRHLDPSSSPPHKREPHDKWWPFLATLPRRFATVPLWWAVHARSAESLAADFPLNPDVRPSASADGKDKVKGKGKAAPVDPSLVELAQEGAEERQERRRRARRYAELRELMPHGVRRRALEIERRFAEDWAAVRRVWGDVVGGDFGVLDFALGFLNVNTRCIWFNVDPSSKDNNLTLCPVIDMINHAPRRTTKPEALLSTLAFSSPTHSSPDPPLADGDELCFSYGPHEDAMLLAEYGFVVGRTNEHNAVEIDRFVEALFDAQGREGELKRQVLEDEGYWGDMTLQSGPDDSPSASWRVLVALRLLYLRLPSHLAASTSPSLSLSGHDALAPWQHVVSGAAERISVGNEKVVQGSLQGVCGAVEKEALAGLARCAEVRARWDKEAAAKADEEGDESGASLDMLETVWREEARIAKAVAGRAHPLARREAELVQAAILASTASSSSAASSARGPAEARPPPAPQPTKYGTLHGTLGTATSSKSATLYLARRVHHTSSDERILTPTVPHLASSSTASRPTPHAILPTDPSTYPPRALPPPPPPPPRLLVADTPAASTSASASVSDPIVSVSTTAARPTMATDAISNFSSADKWGAKNPLAGACAAPGRSAAAREQDDELVVGDSDGEGGGSASMPLSSAPNPFGALPPLPGAAPASSSSLSSAANDDAHRLDSAHMSSTTTTDPIAMTSSTTPRAAAPAPVAKKPQPRPRGETLTVEIPERARTVSKGDAPASSKKKKRALPQQVEGDGDGEDEEGQGGTDYDEVLPGAAARKGPAKKAKKVSRAIVQSSDEDDDGVAAADGAPSRNDASPAPVAGSSTKRARSTSTASAAAAPRSRKKSVAVSEDEDGEAALLRAIAEQNERAEEGDSDFGGGAAGRKKKKVVKRAGSARKGSAGAAKEKAAPRRRPTVKRDGAAPPAAVGADVEMAVEAAAKPSRRKASKTKSVSDEFVDDDADQVEPEPQHKPEAAVTAAAPVVDDEDDEDGAVVGKKQAQKRKRAIADSDDSDAAGPAPAPAPSPSPPVVVQAAATSKAKKDKNASKPSRKKATAAPSTPDISPPPKRGRRTAATKNAYCPSSEVEPEAEPGADAGAASDATSAIRTEDESDEDSNSDGDVGSASAKGNGKSKGKAKAPSKQKKGKGKSLEVDAEPAAAAANLGPLASRKRSAGAGTSRSPEIDRRRTVSLEARVAALMGAASGSPDKSLAAAKPASKGAAGPARAKGKGKAVPRKETGMDADDEDEEDEDEKEAKEPAPPSSSADAKENEGTGTPGPSRTTSLPRLNAASTPLLQRSRSASGTPGAQGRTPKPGSIAAILAKQKLPTARPQGLSIRQKLPRLHTNLKPPPPPKAILKNEAPKKKKKKGDESYSDEEKPWFERKDPEEWDDDDHARWQKRCRRVERGLPPDTPTKDD